MASSGWQWVTVVLIGWARRLIGSTNRQADTVASENLVKYIQGFRKMIAMTGAAFSIGVAIRRFGDLIYVRASTATISQF